MAQTMTWTGTTERNARISAAIGDLHRPDCSEPGYRAPEAGPIAGTLSREGYEARATAAGVRMVSDATIEAAGRKGGPQPIWSGAIARARNLDNRDPEGTNTIQAGLAQARWNQIERDLFAADPHWQFRGMTEAPTERELIKREQRWDEGVSSRDLVR